MTTHSKAAQRHTAYVCESVRHAATLSVCAPSDSRVQVLHHSSQGLLVYWLLVSRGYCRGCLHCCRGCRWRRLSSATLHEVTQLSLDLWCPCLLRYHPTAKNQPDHTPASVQPQHCALLVHAHISTVRAVCTCVTCCAHSGSLLHTHSHLVLTLALQCCLHHCCLVCIWGGNERIQCGHEALGGGCLLQALQTEGRACRVLLPTKAELCRNTLRVPASSPTPTSRTVSHAALLLSTLTSKLTTLHAHTLPPT